MKTRMTALFSVVLVVAMLFCLVGCGYSAKKQEAIESFNSISIHFNEVATEINANKDLLSDETMTVFQQMSALLNQYSEVLQGETVSDEQYDAMIEWFDSVEKWITAAEEELDMVMESVD